MDNWRMIGTETSSLLSRGWSVFNLTTPTVAPVADEWHMSIKVWLNNTDRGKRITQTACSSVKFSTTNLCCYFIFYINYA
jgi:hypothetical protein